MGESNIAEIPERPMKPVEDTGDGIRFLGVEVKKAKDTTSPLIPRAENFARIKDTREALELQRTIALAMSTGDPLNIEGRTRRGKSDIPLKMAAMLGYQVISITGNGFKDPDELEEKFTEAFRQEPGVKRMLLIDEANAILPDVWKGMNRWFDEYKRSGNRDLAIILTSNPASGDYKGIVPAGADLAARVPTYRLSEHVTEEDKRFYGMSLIKKAPEFPAGLSEDDFLISREEPLELEDLERIIPNFVEEWEKYVEWDIQIHQMQRNGSLDKEVFGEPVVYADYGEPDKVLEFLQLFCPDGATSIIPTLQKALTYYYASKYEPGSDSHKTITEKIATLGGEPTEVPDAKEHRDEDWE